MTKVTIGGRSYEVEVKGDSVVVDGHEFPVKVGGEGAMRTVSSGGVQYRVQLPEAGARQSGMAVEVDYRPFTLEWEGRLGSGPARAPRVASSSAAAGARAAVAGGIVAPIAGKVLRIATKAGETVAAGDVLLVLEAMKMENEIKATAAGTVKEILVIEGARVGEGDTLVVVG
ncbi:MAG: biotin/lipoyl-containing protein [Dehalococcoidia bacterium]